MNTPPLYLVLGAVTDAAGRPVVGARLTLVRGPEPLPALTVRTDAEGAFALAVLGPGAYELECRSAGRPSVRQTFTLVTPSARVRVQLPEPAAQPGGPSWKPMPKTFRLVRLSQ